MHFDLHRAHNRCVELGLSATIPAEDCLAIAAGHNAVLWVQNAEKDEDSAIGFSDAPWHVHDDLMFVDGSGNYIEMGYLEMLERLADGHLLVCEVWRSGVLADRCLIHRIYNDALGDIQPNEEPRIFRVTTHL
jgi:hypothetical protein